MAGTTSERVIRVSEVLFQQILAVFVLLIIWELFKSNNYPVEAKKTWHIIMSVLGIALCMAEGVQIYRKQSIVTFGETRDDRKKAHLFIMFFGFLCLSIGISLIISDKETGVKRPHFESTHSKLGLSAWIISFVTVLGGLLAYKSQSISRISPRIIKIVHIFVGLTAYFIGVVALIYGLEYLMGGQTRGWVLLVVLLVIYVAYSIAEPVMSLFSYILDR